ncbi:MAG: dual specificity protein phosphatase family protein [Simkaniaceae bacterium]|nr:dual specificity protein phosphatase family protein [Simkaniaceae bacterium]
MLFPEHPIFYQELVQVVDQTEHLLLRGNIPRNQQGQFCFPSLLGAIYSFISPPFDLMVISLLTFEREDEASLIKEMHAFYGTGALEMGKIESHPLFGKWVWWQVRAHLSHDPPFSPSTPLAMIQQGEEETDLSLLTEQSFDGRLLSFPKLVDLVFDIMHTPSEKPHVIYFHCRHGRNRSSALAIAYLMRCGLSLEEAWEKENRNYPIYEPQELASFLSLYERLLRLRSTS